MSVENHGERCQLKKIPHLSTIALSHVNTLIVYKNDPISQPACDRLVYSLSCKMLYAISCIHVLITAKTTCQKSLYLAPP
jgi:hypothetical protein